MKPFLAGALCLFLLPVAVYAIDPYQNDSLFYQDRARDLVSRMSLTEKAAQINSWVPAISRLGLPEYIYHQEAIHGWWDPWKTRTYTVFPVPLAMGATWDPNLVEQVGGAISDEARGNHNVDSTAYINVFSPTINLARDPRWGRTEETYSEDPYLLSRLAVAYVLGMQGNNARCLKTGATLKHFAANNYEAVRNSGSSDVDERSLREYYFPAFEAGVAEGRSRSVMSAYNAVNGIPSNVNSWLLGDVLRNTWGFSGYVTSDCGDIADTMLSHNYVNTIEQAGAKSVLAGCDSDCGSYEYRDYLPSAVKNRILTEADVDLAARRVLETRFLFGELDSNSALCPYNSIPQSEVNSQAHRDLARQVEREAIVLLKNSNNILPLSKSLSSIALIGPYAADYYLGPYSNPSPPYKISPQQGIRNKLPSVTINYAQGANMDGSSTDAMINAAAAAAAKSQVAIVVLGTNDAFSNEGLDAANLDLPGRQTELAQRVFAANPNTVVVLNSGNPLSINWIAANIPAVLESWHGGQEYGNALADVLFGDYNPGGKLPVTYYKDSNLLPPMSNYTIFNKRLYMYCDDSNVLYPFGHGLSYTTFSYSNLALSRSTINSYDTVTVSVDVKNTGSRAGDEVVQLYLKDVASSVVMPKKALKGFARVSLQPAETKTVSFTLKGMDGAYYNVNQKRFVVESGSFSVMVGSSSNDIRQTATLNINWVEPQYPDIYKIVNRNSGLALEVSQDTQDYNGQTIIQNNYYGYNTQQWRIERVDDQSYVFVNLRSNYVLDVRDVSTLDGAIVQQWKYGGADNQKFIITDVGGGYVSIKAKHSGKALDVTGSSTAAGAVIRQYPYSGSLSQQWRIIKVDRNETVALPPAWVQERKVLIRGGGKYLSAKNNNVAIYANAASGGADEMFYLYNLASGSVALKAEFNGKYLGVDAASLAVYADKNSVSTAETFDFVDLGNSQAAFKSKMNNKYLTLGSGGLITASKDTIGPTESFYISSYPVSACTPNQVSGCKMCEADGSDWVDIDAKCLSGYRCLNGVCVINTAPTTCLSVSIKADVNDKYVCAENGGNSSLIANRDAVGPWEIFDLIPIGDGSIGMRSYANGRYVTAENAGNSSLIANRDALGLWEKFYLIDSGSGYVGLKAAVNNKYVTAENAGASPLIANRDLLGPWEKFYLSASSAGNCVASCVNECSPLGTRQCRGNGYWTCGNYDYDSCLEWSTVTNCAAGSVCQGGVCVAVSTTTTTTSTSTTTSSTSVSSTVVSTTSSTSVSSTIVSTTSTTSTVLTTTSTSSSTSSPTTSTTLAVCYSTGDSFLTIGINLVSFETPHNYPNNLDCYSGSYTCPPGFLAKVHVKYDTETWYDYFYAVYNSATGNATAFSGNSSGYVWVDTGYNSLHFRFTSDESITRWGVSVDLIECVGTPTTTTTSTPSSTSSTTQDNATTSTMNPTTTSSSAVQTTTTTTMHGPCQMKGNEPPCEEVTLTEVIGAINQWVSGNLSLGEVIDLINSWADAESYPPA